MSRDTCPLCGELAHLQAHHHSEYKTGARAAEFLLAPRPGITTGSQFPKIGSRGGPAALRPRPENTRPVPSTCESLAVPTARYEKLHVRLLDSSTELHLTCGRSTTRTRGHRS